MPVTTSTIHHSIFTGPDALPDAESRMSSTEGNNNLLQQSGFHSLGYKKFQDFSTNVPRLSRTPKAFFHDPDISQQCLNIETNSRY